jgi:hypothetical protein
MARLRPIKSVRVLTVEEKTRVANFFTLLVEVNLQTGAANKRRSPKTAKAKKVGLCYYQHKPTSLHPSLKATEDTARLARPGPIDNHCHIFCVNTTIARMRKSSSPMRDLFLKPFARIFKGGFNFSMRYSNDRHCCINTPSRIIHYHQS